MRRATAVLLLATVLAAAGGSLTAGAAASPAAGPPPPRAMAAFEWNNPGRLSANTERQRLLFLRNNGFRTVYLDLSEYLGVADQPPYARGRAKRLEEIRRHLRRFVATATSLGLAVHAVSGAPDWTGGLSYLGRKLVRLVSDYNTRVAAKERLKGVQLDIEPYVDQLWWDRLPTSLREYLAALKSVVDTYRPQLARPANRGLQLGFAIPFWLDVPDELPGSVFFNNRTKPATHHIIDMVKSLPGAYLVVMSYRLRTDTPNGSIALAEGEFAYARSVGAKCGLVVGQQWSLQEGGPVEEDPDGEDPPRTVTTFHGRPRSVFLAAAAEITRTLGAYPQFRGLSIDSIDDYRNAVP